MQTPHLSRLQIVSDGFAPVGKSRPELAIGVLCSLTVGEVVVDDTAANKCSSKADSELIEARLAANRKQLNFARGLFSVHP